MTYPFQLFLCSTDTPLIAAAVTAGVDGVIVEWEDIEADSNQGQPETSPAKRPTPKMVNQLSQVRNATDTWVICRLNPYSGQTQAEIETAVELGADEIWLPKVAALSEVEAVLAQVNYRCQVGIVVETLAALEILPLLSPLPITRIHVGINDLAEALGNPHSFCAIADGTVERIFQQISPSMPHGCMGLTLPDKGDPIPSRLIMGELVRLGCTFSLLRRSFLADVQGQDLSQALSKIRTGLAQMTSRPPSVIDSDRQALNQRIEKILAAL
ncbi:MAG: aldolase/citrate lyase family protein [Cyanobacteria bacterium J06629_9]